MNSSNHILSTQEKLEAYLEGNLSEQECADFLKEIEADPFSKDALEGYQSNPGSLHSLSKLKAKSSQFAPANFTPIFYSMFVLFSIGFGSVFVFYLNNSSPLQSEELVTVSPVVVTEIKEDIIASKPIQELADNRIDASVLKKEKEQVQYKNLIQKEITKALDTLGGNHHPVIQQNLKKIEQKPVEQIIKEEHKELETESVPLFSLHGLINVNYEKIESEFKFKKTVVSLTGVPANVEGGSTINNEPSHELKTTYISYGKYLGDIQYYFRRNKFKKALKGYKEILKQHPTDINAHFYSALCYYNINQSAKSLEHLDVVLQHQYDSFRQEGEWYKAQVLYDLGKKDEAVKMLTRIVSRNDFYAVQAKSFLLEIKG